MDVVDYFIDIDPVVEVLINQVAEGPDTLHGHLKGLVALIEVLLGARKVTRLCHLLHTDILELRLRLNCILIHEGEVLSRLFDRHFRLDFFDDCILFPIGFFIG